MMLLTFQCLLTNKIPFVDVYGDINLVGHEIKSYKGLYGRFDHVTTKNGILFVIFPFDTN